MSATSTSQTTLSEQQTARQGTQLGRRSALRLLLRKVSERELVERAKEGEEEAFDELVRRHEPQVRRLALKVTKDETLAQEVMQDVFLRMFTKLHSFEGRSTLSTWLYRVTLNSSFMLLRSQKRHIHDEWSAEECERMQEESLWNQTNLWDAPADSQFERKELRSVIQESLDELAPHHREVLILREWEGLPNKEIASLLGLSLSAAKSCLHRARNFFRDQFQERWEAMPEPDATSTTR
jgi:RNA polymerase sigma-70 factor (ECF subfamily)